MTLRYILNVRFVEYLSKNQQLTLIQSKGVHNVLLISEEVSVGRLEKLQLNSQQRQSSELPPN